MNKKPSLKQLFVMALSMAIVFPFLAIGQAPDTAYVLVFQDEYHGDTLNTNEWQYRDMTGEYLGGYNKAENVSVETRDGVSYLRIDYSEWDANGDGTDDVVGGGIVGRKALGYGYYETRMKFYDESKGFHQSFWNHGISKYGEMTDKYFYNEDAKNDLVPWKNTMLEIDAIELDSDHNAGGANFHWNSPESFTPPGVGQAYSSSYLNTDNWVTIGFEWRPGLILWYIDGVVRNRFSYVDERYAPQEIWITGLANTISWFGGGGTPLPDAHMKVDYFRYYTAPFVSNLLANASFEANTTNSEVPYNWIQDDGIYDNIYGDGGKAIVDGNAYKGNGYYKYTSISGRSMATKQNLHGIANGIYKLNAWVKSSGGLNVAKMRANVGQDNEVSIEIPKSSTWTQINIDSIEVKNNFCTIDFLASGSSGLWICVDDVEFINQTNSAFGQVTELLIDNGDTGYSETGEDWGTSGLSGYMGSSTRTTNGTGASAKWESAFPETALYDVYLYKVVHANSDPNAKIEIQHADGVTTQYLNFTSGEAGWVKLGTFRFEKGETGYIKNSLNTSGKYMRADAVKFEISDDTSPLESNLIKHNHAYPNPLKNRMYIKNTDEINEINIYNTQGLHVLNTMGNMNEGIDISSLNNGLYIVVMTGNKRSYTQKVIKSSFF